MQPEEISHISSSEETAVDIQGLQYILQEKDAEIAKLHELLSQATGEQCSAPMSYSKIKHDDSLVSHYTGLPDDKTFVCLLNFVHRFNIVFHSWSIISLSHEDQILLTLMKLRHNFTHTHLGFLFSITKATVTNIVSAWIDILHSLLFSGIMTEIGIPSRAKASESLPDCFSSFPGVRLTLDCTEIQCSIPRTSMAQQSQTFSHYKQRNTFKGLVGVSPNGAVTFVSDLYPGSVSDKEIVLHSKVLLQFEPGDLILADKGFLLHDVMPQGVSVNIPPFLSRQQFTKPQVIETTRIARARIHVERAIQHIKLYKILDFVPTYYRGKANKMFQLCACLTNLQNPVIKDVDLNTQQRLHSSKDFTQ